MHQIPVSIAHRHRKRLGEAARRVERLNRCGLFCEGIVSRRPGHRQRAVGAGSGHRQGVPGDCSTDNAIGKRLHIHISACQRTAQPGLVGRRRLIHLGDRPFGDGRQDSRIIRTGHRHPVSPTHRRSIPVGHRHLERIRAALTHIEGFDRGPVLCERVGSANGVYRESAIGTNLADHCTRRRPTQNPVGQGVPIGIRARQNAAQSAVDRGRRLIQLGDCPRGHRRWGRRVVRASDGHRVGPGHQGPVAVAHVHRECVRHRLGSV